MKRKASMQEAESSLPPNGAPEGSVAGEAPPQELPNGYGEDRITAMVRDPHWVFVYWEITPRGLDSARQKLGSDGASLSLRVYDITGITFTGRNAHRSFDIDIAEHTGGWHINTRSPGASFCVDIGLLDERGEFRTIARSNTVSTPRASASDESDERWMGAAGEFERIYALSGGFEVGASSADLQKLIDRRLRMLLESEAVGSFSDAAGCEADR